MSFSLIPCRWKLLPELVLRIPVQYKMHKRYPFIVDTPDLFGSFLLFADLHHLGENFLIYSDIWGPRIL